MPDKVHRSVLGIVCYVYSEAVILQTECLLRITGCYHVHGPWVRVPVWSLCNLPRAVSTDHSYCPHDSSCMLLLRCTTFYPPIRICCRHSPESRQRVMDSDLPWNWRYDQCDPLMPQHGVAVFSLCRISPSGSALKSRTLHDSLQRCIRIEHAMGRLQAKQDRSCF